MVLMTSTIIGRRPVQSPVPLLPIDRVTIDEGVASGTFVRRPDEVAESRYRCHLIAISSDSKSSFIRCRCLKVNLSTGLTDCFMLSFDNHLLQVSLTQSSVITVLITSTNCQLRKIRLYMRFLLL
ncbi:unnamed protein product [Soboliphyme baturini]|uniref:Uncharacterized protein n=1 Tax=Soboliphyme baturini TaxID=241478 RepID=A0A183IYM0_9BILA|nr:unnamed protein product [Soboliphyme baturini]